MASYKTTIKKFFRGEIYADEKTLEAYSIDTSLFRVHPKLVAVPKNVDDLKALVLFASKEKKRGGDISLTARSAGTDMTGGPLNESIIVDFTKHFNKVVSVNSETATAQPGVYYRDFDTATKKKHRILPSYPASRDLCTVGGMVANNSGGEKTLLYGKTDRYVKELKMVLADGKEHSIKPITLNELAKKEKLKSFEGKMYRSLHKLVAGNEDILRSAKPNVSKNSSGYALWNVLNHKEGIFDLTQLFVGSQGTLGLVTEATFSLVEPKEYSRLLVIFLDDMSVLGDLVGEIVACRPESFESYDDHTFKIALKLFPQIVRRLKGNILMLGLRFLPEFFSVLIGGVPKLVLLAEFTADSDRVAHEKALAAQKRIAGFNLKTRITSSKADAEKYWTVRRESFNLLRQKVKNTRTAPFIDDLIVRPEVLPEFLPKLYDILDQYSLTYTIAGHMGDGNFHIIPLMDLTDPQSIEIIEELIKKVYTLVWSFHGSNTGEHNDGILRTPYLPEMYGKDVYKLFEKTKAICDPLNIFNPGKKVGGSIEYAEKHINAR